MSEWLTAHKEYITYLFKHKYWVYRIGRQMGLSRWRLITHDLSKLLPSEWFGYVKWKREQTKAGGGGLENDREFGYAWFWHQHRNFHHWQAYIHCLDNGELFVVDMPLVYRKELIADWKSAGLVRFGDASLKDYYATNKDKMMFHPETRRWIEEFINNE